MAPNSRTSAALLLNNLLDQGYEVSITRQESGATLFRLIKDGKRMSFRLVSGLNRFSLQRAMAKITSVAIASGKEMS